MKKQWLTRILLATILLCTLTLPLVSCGAKDVPSEEISEEITELPLNPDKERTPMMWDYVHSSLGYQMDSHDHKHFMQYDSFYAFMLNPQQNALWVESYTIMERLITPSLGSKPESLIIQDPETLKDAVDSLDDELKYEEDGWILCVVPMYPLKNFDGPENYAFSNRWGGFDVREFHLEYPGEMQEWIESGMGWPTEWLQQSGIVENMKENGFDMNNSFWERHPLYSYKKYNNMEVKVIQYDTFQINGGMTLNEKQLQEYLEQMD